MNIPAARWYSVIERRRSRRRFRPEPLEASLLSQIVATCTEFKPFPNARAVLVTEAPDTVFKGALGPYGKIKGAPAFIAFIGNMDSPNVLNRLVMQVKGLYLKLKL